MHPQIRTNAAKMGFTEDAGTFVILPYGAEQASLVVSALGGAHAVDTLAFMQSLCSVPNPEATLHALVDEVLKPGGTMVFYEHVLSPRADVAWWQRFWAPMWMFALAYTRLSCSVEEAACTLVCHHDWRRSLSSYGSHVYCTETRRG